MIAHRAFAEQVLERVAEAEKQQAKREWLRCLLPLSIIVIVSGAWAIALLDGAIALRWSIQVVAWLSLVGAREEHLASELLGPLAGLPLLVSLLLLLAALAWVRVHQTEPRESRDKE